MSTVSVDGAQTQNKHVNIVEEIKDTKEDDTKEEEEIVAILDAGSQYGKVIDRRVRELNVESVLIPFNTPALQLKKYKAIIISGGPSSVYAKNAPAFDKQLFHINKPIFGICYGFQLMAHEFEGIIQSGKEREDGQYLVNITNNTSPLFKDIHKDKIKALLTHGDSVVKPPKDFEVIAISSNNIIAGFQNTKLNLYGVQFHPEVDLTPEGKQMYSNFLFHIAKCKGKYTIQNRKENAIQQIQEKVGNKNVLLLVSGGVDSSVCGALLRCALDPKKIFPVHVDSGFMRHQESAQVSKALKNIGLNVYVKNAQDDFLNGTTFIDGKQTCKLCETTNPEIKRKIIGDVFMKLCDDIVKQQFNLKFEDMILAQGTLRPDLIESASNLANKGGTADVIKTHHNDTLLVRKLRSEGRVIEPLTDYHKDEVRALGEQLGLPRELVWRQPFPGPGLAIRIICCDGPYTTPYDNDILEQLSRFATDDIGICLLGFQTVGVQGDGRTYSHCVGLTYKNANKDNKIPWPTLYELAKTIPRQIRLINRCIFIFGDALTGHCKEVTKTLLQKDSISQVRECDRIVNEKLAKYDLIHSLSQVPVILFPSNFGNEGKRSVCIRTFMTNDFMTGVPAVVDEDIKESILLEMVSELSQVENIERVAFDLTPKPPGTTEWE